MLVAGDDDVGSCRSNAHVLLTYSPTRREGVQQSSRAKASRAELEVRSKLQLPAGDVKRGQKKKKSPPTADGRGHVVNKKSGFPPPARPGGWAFLFFSFLFRSLSLEGWIEGKKKREGAGGGDLCLSLGRLCLFLLCLCCLLRCTSPWAISFLCGP
jgi:hypothetical protein